MRASVKAIVMQGPYQLSLNEFPYPKILNNSALIKVELAGICGTDKHMYKGEIIHPRGIPANFPIIPGHEVVGVIENIGKEAKKEMGTLGETLNEGDRVVVIPALYCKKCFYCKNYYGISFCEHYQGHYGWGLTCKDPPHLFGGWSEYLYALPGSFLAKVPFEIPPEVAVLTEPFTVPYMVFNKAMHPYSLVKEGFSPGDSVVIQGSGPIGLAHLIFAKIIGAGQIIVIGRPKYRLEIAKKYGATSVINIDEVTDPQDRVEEVLKLTDKRGADIVIEATGYPEAVNEGLEMLRILGTYIIVGLYIDMGEIRLNPQRKIVSKWAHVIGIPGQTYQSYAAVLKIFKQYRKKIPFEEMITHVYKLEEAKEAMNKALSEECMKVVFKP